MSMLQDTSFQYVGDVPFGSGGGGDQPLFFVFLELDHLAIEQALHFSIVVIMLNFKLKFWATMLTKLHTCGYLHKQYVKNCGKMLVMIFIEI